MTDLITTVAVAAVLIIVVWIAASLTTGHQIRDAIAAQPAPVIHNTATVNAGGASLADQPVNPLAVIGVFVGLVILIWAFTGFSINQPSEQPAAQPIAQPAAQPIAQPAAQPIPTAVHPVSTLPATQSAPLIPAAVPAPVPQIGVYADILSIAVPVLAVIALGLWAYIVRAWYSLRQQRQPIHRTQPTSAQREQHLNDIIPDVVNEL